MCQIFCYYFMRLPPAMRSTTERCTDEIEASGPHIEFFRMKSWTSESFEPSEALSLSSSSSGSVSVTTKDAKRLLRTTEPRCIASFDTAKMDPRGARLLVFPTVDVAVKTDPRAAKIERRGPLAGVTLNVLLDTASSPSPPLLPDVVLLLLVLLVLLLLTLFSLLSSTWDCSKSNFSDEPAEASLSSSSFVRRPEEAAAPDPSISFPLLFVRRRALPSGSADALEPLASISEAFGLPDDGAAWDLLLLALSPPLRRLRIRRRTLCAMSFVSSGKLCRMWLKDSLLSTRTFVWRTGWPCTS
eukprot:PhM_4_TR10100/c2_g1_i2/m.65674